MNKGIIGVFKGIKPLELKLRKEITRCEELLKIYNSIPQGWFGASHIKRSLDTAYINLKAGDIVAMMESLNELESKE